MVDQEEMIYLATTILVAFLVLVNANASIFGPFISLASWNSRRPRLDSTSSLYACMSRISGRELQMLYKMNYSLPSGKDFDSMFQKQK